MPRVTRSHIRLVLALLVLAAGVFGAPYLPQPGQYRDLSALLVITGALAVAFCLRMPIHHGPLRQTLAHAVVLALHFAFGPAVALGVFGLGLLAAVGAAALTGVGRRVLLDVTVRAVVQELLPLLPASFAFAALGGSLPPTNILANAFAVVVFALTYFGLYNLLLALDLGAPRLPVRAATVGTVGRLVLLQLVPLPVALYAAAGHHLVGPTLLPTFMVVLVVVAGSLHSLTEAQKQLEVQAEEKARLFDETRRQTAELVRLLNASSGLSATLSTEDALSLICPSAWRIADAAGAALFLIDPATRDLRLAFEEGLGAGFAGEARALSAAAAGPLNVLDAGPPRSLAVDELPAAWREPLAGLGMNACVSLALLARGDRLGVLAIFFTAPPLLPSWTLEVLQAFGSQAALTIANTRRYERTEAALARRVSRLAALASTSRELNATLDLQRLFDVVVARAVDVTGASRGRLGIAEPGGAGLRIAAHGGPPAPGPISALASRVLNTGRAELVHDLNNGRTGVLGTRSQLGVPIVYEERPLGVILLESERRDAFGAEDQEFVEQLAVQAAIAIANARLYAEVRARLREESILYETGLALSAVMDWRAIYPVVAQKLAEAVSADDCALSEYDAGAEAVQTTWQLAAGESSRRFEDAYRLADHPATAQVLRGREPLIVQADDPEADAAEVRLLRAEGHHTLLALPMVAGDRVVGLVELYARERRDFAPNEIRLAQTLANQAAIALENARLFQRVTEGRDRLVAVLNSTREGVLVVEASGLVSLVNPRLEDFWGVPADQVVGQNLVALLDQPRLDVAGKLGFQPDEILELLQTLRAGLALTIPKRQYQLTEPRLRFVERAGEPVLDQMGKAIGWVITLRDISEERELQDVRDALSSMIVHDLRSPLNAVLAGASLVRDHLPAAGRTPVVSQGVDVAIRSTRRMIALVNTLLDIARMESGDMALQRSAVSLYALADEVIAELLPLAAEHGVILICEVPPGLPVVLADRDKLSRVLTNLVDNALKFTPPGGRVWVRGAVASTEPMLVCAVADTGPGVPEDYRDKIFDRFVQVSGRTGRRQGTGLGLAFCKLAIEAHGGRIWAENRPEGGSLFEFTLPLATGAPPGEVS